MVKVEPEADAAGHSEGGSENHHHEPERSHGLGWYGRGQTVMARQGLEQLRRKRPDYNRGDRRDPEYRPFPANRHGNTDITRGEHQTHQ